MISNIRNLKIIINIEIDYILIIDDFEKFDSIFYIIIHIYVDEKISIIVL